MRYILPTLCLLLPFLSFTQEEIEYKEYSYTEFFQMIEDEEDTVFRLSNALIKYDKLTDAEHLVFTHLKVLDPKTYSNYQRTDTIFVEKPVYLDNVQFITIPDKSDESTDFLYKSYTAGLFYISFEEEVQFIDMAELNLGHVNFKKSVNFSTSPKFEAILKPLNELLNIISSENGRGEYLPGIIINNTSFLDNSEFRISQNTAPGETDLSEFSIQMDSSKFYAASRIVVYNTGLFSLLNCAIDSLKKDRFRTTISNVQQWEISNNHFLSTPQLNITSGPMNIFGSMENNYFDKYVRLNLNAYGGQIEVNEKWEIDWLQFHNKTVTTGGIGGYTQERRRKYYNQNPQESENLSAEEFRQLNFATDELISEYKSGYIASIPESYKNERALRIQFLDYYKKKYDQVNQNLVYVEIKDLETLHLASLYRENPNFDTFFSWKINQFLKIFSLYGTKPSRAIIFSMYVILAFALVYLFFPNHWDSHGKNRIIDRFSFFLKYMKRDAGMHDVYLEEKQGDILAYDEYKGLLESSGKDVPKFFQATGLPLYKWAISSTKMTAGFLSRVDVMKGTWSELPQSKRVWKSVLLIGAFLIALTYDIFIKMLNALMLSINTFTTLGFGEIPIKGLPRYLAIIQGFIGWFMLTIFSVSLISQLLN